MNNHTNDSATTIGVDNLTGAERDVRFCIDGDELTVKRGDDGRWRVYFTNGYQLCPNQSWQHLRDVRNMLRGKPANNPLLLAMQEWCE